MFLFGFHFAPAVSLEIVRYEESIREIYQEHLSVRQDGHGHGHGHVVVIDHVSTHNNFMILSSPTLSKRQPKLKLSWLSDRRALP